MYLTPPLSEFPLELCNGGSGQKIYTVMSLSDNGKSLTICAFIWIQYLSVTDRQADKRIC